MRLSTAQPVGTSVCSPEANDALAVIFQEVVHSVRAGKAEVVEASVILGGPNEHPQECPFDTIASRGDGQLRD